MTTDLEANIAEFNRLRAALKKKIDDERDRLLRQLDGYENGNGPGSENAALSTSATEKAEPVQVQDRTKVQDHDQDRDQEPPADTPTVTQAPLPIGTQAGEIKQKVFAEMKEWNTVNGIVAATGLTHGQVRGVLSSRKNRMEFQVRMTDGNKWYRLRPEKAAPATGPTPKAATGGGQAAPVPTPAAAPTPGAGNALPQ
jgi:hypothetical protein